jgi:hypothetical protein
VNVTRFSTLPGSMYEVRDGGRRTFRRAGPARKGPRPQWSELTVYVEPHWAFWLELHLQCECRLALSRESPRRLCLVTPSLGLGVFPQHPAPARRLHPVESFPQGWYVGHTITRLEGR